MSTGFDAWFGGDLHKVFLRFSKERMLAKDYDLDELRKGYETRGPEDGAFDGQPYVVMDPVLTVEQVRRAKRRMPGHKQKKDKTTVRYIDDHAEVDVENDEDFPLRQLAEAIKSAGGDWDLYWSRHMTEAVRQRMKQWDGLERAQKVECLRHFAKEDINGLSKLCNRPSQPTESELGK